MSATAPAYVDVTEIRGAAIDLNTLRWPPETAAANLHFLMLLGELTGRVEESAAGYSEVGYSAQWMRLADVDEGALETVIRRMEGLRRSYPAWRLEGGTATTIHQKVAVHFATAQARWRREQGLA